MSSTSSQIMTDEPARLGKTSATLSYFCVYNPSLGPTEENAKDQILYYTAKKVVPADIKMKQVGLAQALVNFTSTFSQQSIQNVHSQKNRMVFLQPEPGFWMHMCVELGILRKQIKDTKGKEKLVTEYLDSQLNDRALECVLRVGYEQFKLLNGTFSSILCGSDQTNRQRTRALMHAIEEFFSEWIWRWDFENTTACFTTTVFNGVPIRPIVRSNYMRIRTMDNHIQDAFEHAISHAMILDHANGLVYRSPSLSIYDVRALRKYVMKRAEKHKEQEKSNAASKKDLKLTSLKSLTKTLSNTHILNYFSTGSKSTEPTPSTSTESEQQVDNNDVNSNDESEYSKQGVYLTGLVESTAIGMNGEERPITKTDIIRVYLSSKPEEPQDIASKDGDVNEEELSEYYLVVYKHKSGLVWCFLLKATSDSEDLLSDPSFYSNLENQMVSQNLDQLVSTVIDNINSGEEKSLQLEKNFKCFYYDNTTLAIKSTLMESNIVSNEMLLQLLEIKDDFEKIARTSEVYTRSINNYWIAGHRIYNGLSAAAGDETSMARSSLYECSAELEDYIEMYLVAAKKDTSLADVEDTLKKMTHSLLDTMHAE